MRKKFHKCIYKGQNALDTDQMDYVYPKYKLTNLYEPNWSVDYQPEWLTYTEEDAEEDKRQNEIAAARERKRKRQEEREEISYI